MLNLDNYQVVGAYLLEVPDDMLTSGEVGVLLNLPGVESVDAVAVLPVPIQTLTATPVETKPVSKPVPEKPKPVKTVPEPEPVYPGGDFNDYIAPDEAIDDLEEKLEDILLDLREGVVDDDKVFEVEKLFTSIKDDLENATYAAAAKKTPAKKLSYNNVYMPTKKAERKTIVPQKERIISCLKKGSTLTSAQAAARFGVMNLRARINDLRDDGYTIATDYRKMRNRTNPVAVYSLIR